MLWSRRRPRVSAHWSVTLCFAPGCLQMVQGTGETEAGLVLQRRIRFQSLRSLSAYAIALFVSSLLRPLALCASLASHRPDVVLRQGPRSSAEHRAESGRSWSESLRQAGEALQELKHDSKGATSDLSPSLGRWRRRRRLRMHTIPKPIQRLRGLEPLHSPLTAVSLQTAALPPQAPWTSSV